MTIPTARPLAADGRFVAVPLLDRLADAFDLIGECWVMRDNFSNHHGYAKISTGQVDRRPKPKLAHVASYELLVGPVPGGRQLDHLCRNKMCINPDHLEPVTPRENVLRGETIVAANVQKTHCHQGHPLSGANLYVAAADPSRRHCRACRAERTRQYVVRKRAALG